MSTAVLSLLLVFGVALPAVASPPAPSNSQVQSLQARATMLEKQIGSDSEQVQIAGEQYDQANASLAISQHALKVLHRELVTERARVVVATHRVQAAAVAAYVLSDGATAQFAAVLSNNIANAGTVSTYAGVATDTLHLAVTGLQHAESRLGSSEARQQHEVATAHRAVIAAQQASAAATAAAAGTKAALSEVKGSLATLIAEQEEAAAAAAAKRAEALAASRARAAREQAEQQASTAAEVAEAVAGTGGSATATAATAANVSADEASEIGEPALTAAGSTAAGDQAVQSAESYLGVPYVWGGASSAGMDCSGLTMVAWASANVTLTHSAWFQYEETEHISLSEIEPGDLLFYYFPDDGGDPVTHVAMYVGQGPYGTNTIIQAPETGETVSYAPMYYLGLVGAGAPTASNNSLAQ